MQNARAAKRKFCFPQPGKQCLIRTICMVIQSQKRDGMHWRKFFPASRRENGSFEVWPVPPIFFIFTKSGCNCLTVIFSEKKPKPFHVQIVPITGRRLPWRFFGCSPRNLGCTWLSQFGHIFSEVWQKCTNFFLVQPGTYNVGFRLFLQKQAK